VTTNDFVNNSKKSVRHRTHKAQRGIERCAIEIMDHSLSGFGLFRTDRAIVVLTRNVEKGQLVLVGTPRGHVIRIMMDCLSPEGAFDFALVSGHLDYGIEEVKLADVDIIGYVSYFERLVHANDGDIWEQHTIPSRIMMIAERIHNLEALRRGATADCDWQMGKIKRANNS
jgi:hypothetical protein